MRIAWITGGLAPERDGVGDYTRRLAAACASFGAPGLLVSLADPEIDSAEQQVQSELPTLRLAARLRWSERLALLAEQLARFAPDWVSFQFVAYSYQPKGIAVGLAERLAPLFAPYRLHLMFHELWLGQHRGAHWREQLVGSAQRWAIEKLVAQLAPRLIHTSNPAYAASLARRGIKAQVLPLFGAIPVAPPGDPWLAETLAALPPHPWLFGLFGALPPEWPPEPLLSEICTLSQKSARPAALLSIGRIGPGEALWEKLTRQYQSQLHFLRLGMQPAERVSALFQALDFGIATAPYQLVGKSSAVAAMLEHGLPVLVNRNDIEIVSGDNLDLYDEPMLLRTGGDLVATLMRGVPRRLPRARLPAVAHQLLDGLAGATDA